MPRLSLPVVAQLPDITVIDARTLEARLNLRRRRYIIQICTFTHNVLYVLTLLSWGLTLAYQVLLDAYQLKARNWIGIFLPIFVPISDPRIACLHEASAPILFLAWSILCAEWLVALLDTSDVRGLRYASKVGCAQGSLAYNILSGYIAAIFGIALCFFTELAVILVIQHGKHICEAFSACWTCRPVVVGAKHDTSIPPVAAPAVPVKFEEFDADYQSTVYTTFTPSASGAQTPTGSKPYELNVDNLRWLEMVHAAESDDEVTPYNVHCQDSSSSAPSVAAATMTSARRQFFTGGSLPTEKLQDQEYEPRLEGSEFQVQEKSQAQGQEHLIHTSHFTPNVCIVSISDEMASPSIHRPMISVLSLIKNSEGARSISKKPYTHHASVVVQSVPATSPSCTCNLLDFNLKAGARFRQEMGFGSYEIGCNAHASLSVAAEQGNENATIQKVEYISAAAEQVDGTATAAPAAAAEGGAPCATEDSLVKDSVTTCVKSQCQSQWESQYEILRNHMCWLAQWDDRLEQNVNWESIRSAFENSRSRSPLSARSSSL
ncbi:hypothetical protein EC991_010244 [Linnemannia zychae]|nr:hypothetical protein EC991_010244 [Linnemannia zychae]